MINYAKRSGNGQLIFRESIMENLEYWSSMPFVRNVLMAALKKGGDLQTLCHEVGVTPEMLEQPDAKANMEQCTKVWEVALRHTGDHFLGLHMGEVTPPGLAGMVGYLMESSPDLLTAYQSLQQFHKVMTNAEDVFLEIQDAEARYYVEPAAIWHLLSVEAARQMVDHSMSASVHINKMLIGKMIYPLRILLRYPRPQNIGEYLRIFKCEPLFNQNCNCLVYRLRDMKTPIIGHNPILNKFFRELLEKEILKTHRRESFANEVRRAILQNFDQVLPQLNDIVQCLHISSRTLQRKLQEEGTSFQQIFESVKLELAIAMLKNPSLTVNEIAYKLGYAEPSVFRRAFKKWTGTSPKAYQISL